MFSSEFLCHILTFNMVIIKVNKSNKTDGKYYNPKGANNNVFISHVSFVCMINDMNEKVPIYSFSL